MLKWAQLAVLRSWALSLAGFGSITVGAFLFSVIAGFITLGVCCLIIEALTSGETRPGEGR